MAWLRKIKGLPGAAPGGLSWTSADDVVEVDDDLAASLLAIPDAGFLSTVAPEAGSPASDVVDADVGGDDTSSPDANNDGKPTAPKARAGRASTSKTAVKE